VDEVSSDVRYGVNIVHDLLNMFSYEDAEAILREALRVLPEVRDDDRIVGADR
jgi:hypothetical protein